VSVVTTNIFLRGQPNKKSRDRQLGPLTMEEQVGKHIYILKLPSTVRLHPMFHASDLRPCSTAPLRPAVPVTVLKGEDDEFDVSHNLCCVHQVVTWTTRQIFALHDALQ
jgi:hypothetical protein